MAIIAAEALRGARRNTADRSRSSDSVVAGSGGTVDRRRDSTRQSKPSPGQFTVIGIGVTIGLVVLVSNGYLPEGTLLAILVFVLLGAIAPAVVIPVGAIILFVLFFKNNTGGAFFDWLNGLGSARSQPSQPLPDIGPISYLPSTNIGSV